MKGIQRTKVKSEMLNGRGRTKVKCWLSRKGRTKVEQKEKNEKGKQNGRGRVKVRCYHQVFYHYVRSPNSLPVMIIQ